jgi:rSAM-associated Gly-rich repeat protein
LTNDQHGANFRRTEFREAQMTVREKTKKALAALLPAGVLGISVALAALAVGQAESLTTERTGSEQTASVAERLSEIRAGVSQIDVPGQKDTDLDGALLAEWINVGGGFGWRNGGWRNGGWGNGGWRNGGWGNGGWHNWGNGGWGNGGGWHNWHNFWHNW